MVIIGRTIVYDALEEYPELKNVLINLSPKFQKLNNPLIYKAAAKLSTFNDIAKIANVSVCTVLHIFNKNIGKEKELLDLFPNCIEDTNQDNDKIEEPFRSKFTNIIDFDTRERTDFFFPELLDKVKTLDKESALKIISLFDPIPLKKMLESMDYTFKTKEINDNLFETYIYKQYILKENSKISVSSEKVPIVLQSATPVAYPIILKMLKSKKLLDKIEIKELKVWRETEKHLGWIIKGKADISFSALMSSAKLYESKKVKMPAIVVWDNFKLLTRGYKASGFSDIKGHKIFTPLFKGAPPFVLTKYLMRLSGENPDDFDFEFGKPFGRPDEIKDMFVNGECDTAILREPEASFALFESKIKSYLSIHYGEIWSRHNPLLTRLPNAGLLFKGEFVDEHPEIVKLFMDELKLAVNWVRNNPRKAAELSKVNMGVPADEVEFFLKNSTIDYKRSDEVLDQLKAYLQLLKDENILANQDIGKTMGLFTI